MQLFKKNIDLTTSSLNQPKNEDFHFNLIDHYFIMNQENSHASQTIKDQMINDIDFYALFAFLDRTQSKIGQQYLFNKLLTIDKKLDFTEQELIIDYFSENKVTQRTIQALLSKLNKRESYYISNLFLDGYIAKPKWFWIIRVLSFITLATLAFSFLYNKIFILLLFLYIANTLIHFWNKNNIMVYSDSIPQLPLFCNIAKKFTSMDILPEAKQSVLSAVNSISKLKYVIKFFKSDSGVKSEIEAFFLLVREIVKILFLIEPMVVFYVLKKLEVKKNDIQTIFEYIGKIDSAISIATIRTTTPHYCIPILLNTNEKMLDFTDIYHPLISDCIPNSLKIQEKSILLTGSNMSGKTTFIRAVALNVLLAQTINTCFAKTFKLSQTRSFSAIRITDDLFSDKSYYFEEVLLIKEMINESQSGLNNVFFLDEIFKGTNTIERIAAGKAVLSYLVKSGQNIVFVSTHDIELADLLSNEYDLYHFTEVIKNEQIHFDYKLKEGNLSTKNAIRILEINNYPKEIVDDAIAISFLLYNKVET